jgi:hypothetical protein
MYKFRAMDVYSNAMSVIGRLFENGEWPELKDKLDDERVVGVLNAFVTGCLELKKADEAFANHSGEFFDCTWDEIEVTYWIEFRRLKQELEKASKVQEEAYTELTDLLACTVVRSGFHQ